MNTIRHILRCLLSLAGIALLLSCSDSDGRKARKEESRVVVAYVTSWSGCGVDPTRMTHINYAFGGVGKDFSSVFVNNEGRLREVVSLKEKNPSLKVCLSVGGWGAGNFSEMAGDPSTRRSFAQDCRRVVDLYGLDGIDIDWEYPTSSSSGISSSEKDTENYTLLMKDLREALGREKLLTLASVCPAQYIDFPSIMPYVDFVNVMSYDMGWAPMHNAPLYKALSPDETSPIVSYSVDEAIRAHLSSGVPSSKLVLGVPFYGRGDSDHYGGFVNYRDIHGPVEGDLEKWDPIARVPYYSSPEGKLLLGFDNVPSMEEKCNYVLENSLLGIMYWEYSGDNDSGDLSRLIAKKILLRE